MAELNPRDMDRSCAPVTIRNEYDSINAALQGAPVAGDIVIIGEEPYYFNGTAFLPYGWQGDIEIPDSAFANPDVPTAAEVATWVNTFYPQSPSGSRFYLVGDGSAVEPEWVFEIDQSDAVTAIEKPSASPNPVAIIELIGQESDEGEYHAGNSYAKATGCALTTFTWTITDVGTGTVIDSFSGAPGADASGETYVQSGNYDQFVMDTIVGQCGDIEVTLEVTDCNGLVSEPVTVLIEDYGLAVMEFNTSEMSFSGTVAVNDGSVVRWDMGDGTILTGGTVNHNYGVAGVYAVTVTACKTAITDIVLNSSGNSGNIGSLFDDDPEGFTGLVNLNLNGAGFGGDMPDHTQWPDIETIDLNGNSIGGFISGDLTSTITVFDLGGNGVGGVVPDPTAATNLTIYDVSNNLFVGDIHDFSSLTSLQVWDVSGTAVTGSLPADISAVTPLRVFRGDNTLISGSLPVVAGLSLLEEFSFDSADLSGTPTALTGLTSLVEYSVSNNGLTGNAPSVSAIGTIQTYDISQNGLDYVAGSIGVANAALTNVSTELNSFSQAEVDDVLCDTDSIGNAGGTINVLDAAPSGVGATCAGNLSGRGWTVITS